MCGIAGIVNISQLPEGFADCIARMVAVQRHRGPDDEGTYTDPFAALGHARLSIIDLQTGRQPICNEDRTVWITFNGEIYNFQELRRELISKGHQFQTNTDTETIVHLYEEEGERCVDRLRGMFAFAIWDQKQKRLLLARDRLGIKPLYYGVQDNTLFFGSEIKALNELPNWPCEIDPQALLDFLTFGWIPAPKSIFRTIRKLPPAHIAIFDDNGLRLSEYWDFSDADPIIADEEVLCDEFRNQLSEAVKLRMIADVPLGAFLSGGIDSSAVVATMSQLSSSPVITNSIGFEESEFNELQYADRVAEMFNTEHHRQIVRSDAAGIVDTLSWHWDEPFADSSAIPTYYLSRMARQNVTVALSGDGGDENQAGYRKYLFGERQRKLRRYLPNSIRRGLFGSLAKIYPKADWAPRIFRAKSTFQELASNDVEAICRARALLQPEISWHLLNHDLRSELRDYRTSSVIDHHYHRTAMTNSLNRELYVDIKTYLVDDILTKVDRASMAVGLEVRVPILDHQFVEFMARIPPQMKLNGRQGKYLFKKAFRPILGQEIIDRPKMGFSIPLNNWLRGPLRELVEDSIFTPDSHVQKWMDMQNLRGHWQALLKGVSRNQALIWSVLILEHWARRFLPLASTASAGPTSSTAIPFANTKS